MAVLLALALPVSLVNRAQAGTVLNGSAPRPFYIYAHNPNTLEEAEQALKDGANALEPDIMDLPDGAYDLGSSTADPAGLVMYHDNVYITTRIPLTLNQYLEGIHGLAVKFPQLALVAFDVKTPAATAARGVEILNSIRNHLNYGPVNLNVIISVASRDDAGIFDNLLAPGTLGPREAVQIDQEDDAAEIVQHFFDLGFSGNIGYGDGTATQGPNLPRAMDKAAFLRASIGFPQSVTYVYTLANESSEHSFINGGADGIIPELDKIPALVAVVNQHPEIRMASREDNPFQPPNEAYGLVFVTGKAGDAGTDADLTITLHGCKGSATITVDTGNINVFYPTGRMEGDQSDWVTIPSADLGLLTSVTIKNDGSGNAAGWLLKSVRVSSARWLGPDFNQARNYSGTFSGYLESGDTTTIALTPNFTEPGPTIVCPGPISVTNDPNGCGAVVHFVPVVSDPCGSVVAVCEPSSGSFFPVGQTVVTCHASSDLGSSVPCSFTVTVLDTESPVMACPSPKVVDATGPSGVTVAFSPTAADNCAIASIVCLPVSGSLFPVGDSTVHCLAKDPSGNSVTCSFTIHVKGAAEQAADLVAQVGNLNVGKGPKNALLVKLNGALGKLQAGQLKPSCNEFGAFINLVQAQRGKALTLAEADALIAKANQIRVVAGC